MRVRAVAVVVPVHQEEELLEGCLAALRRAIERARAEGLRCEVRVVLDRCTDGSAAIAAASGLTVLRVDDGNVGAARARGTAAALAALADEPAEDVWTAHTDADSRVPANWLTVQRRLAERADLVIGTVRPDFRDLPERFRLRWLASHERGKPNGHVHGANLGLRASRYLEIGGFLPLAEHEDVDLVARARAVGCAEVASDAAEVVTSGRVDGRTPGGYAGFLREQLRALGETRRTA